MMWINLKKWLIAVSIQYTCYSSSNVWNAFPLFTSARAIRNRRTTASFWVPPVHPSGHFSSIPVFVCSQINAASIVRVFLAGLSANLFISSIHSIIHWFSCRCCQCNSIDWDLQLWFYPRQLYSYSLTSTQLLIQPVVSSLLPTNSISPGIPNRFDRVPIRHCISH